MVDKKRLVCYICEVLSRNYHAGVAQLVEHNLAKVGVTSSSLATRSI